MSGCAQLAAQGGIIDQAGKRRREPGGIVRRHQQAGFVVDTGRFVRALLTPDDPDAFEAEVRLHVTVKSGSSAGPFV